MSLVPNTQTSQSLTRPGPATLCVLGLSLAADPEVGCTITPSPRSSCSQEKLLQVEVQKLTVELKEQKKQAQLVRRQEAGLGFVLGGGI